MKRLGEAESKNLNIQNTTRCLLGLELQPNLGIVTRQTKTPNTVTAIVESEEEFEWTTSKKWKEQFVRRYEDVFTRLCRSTNHKIYTLFISPILPIQEKVRRVPIQIQQKNGNQIQELIKEEHCKKLHKCTSGQFVAPVVITAKKDGAIKLAINTKPTNYQIFKPKFQPKTYLQIQGENSGWHLLSVRSVN